MNMQSQYLKLNDIHQETVYKAKVKAIEKAKAKKFVRENLKLSSMDI